jgi:Prp8 binding protein
MSIYLVLWNVYGDCGNYNVLTGHQNAVLEVKWSGDHLLSCSADKTVALWDANRGTRIRKYAEHRGIVNSCSMGGKGTGIACSASDDNSVLVWDARSRRSVLSIPHNYQVTSVCMSPDGNSIFSGGIDNTIRYFCDLRVFIFIYLFMSRY